MFGKSIKLQNVSLEVLKLLIILPKIIRKLELCLKKFSEEGYRSFFYENLLHRFQTDLEHLEGPGTVAKNYKHFLKRKSFELKKRIQARAYKENNIRKKQKKDKIEIKKCLVKLAHCSTFFSQCGLQIPLMYKKIQVLLEEDRKLIQEGFRPNNLPRMKNRDSKWRSIAKNIIIKQQFLPLISRIRLVKHLQGKLRNLEAKIKLFENTGYCPKFYYKHLEETKQDLEQIAHGEAPENLIKRERDREKQQSSLFRALERS